MPGEPALSFASEAHYHTGGVGIDGINVGMMEEGWIQLCDGVCK